MVSSYVETGNFLRQTEEDLYCNSKSGHSAVEKYFMKHVAKFYKGARITSVTYH